LLIFSRLQSIPRYASSSIWRLCYITTLWRCSTTAWTKSMV